MKIFKIIIISILVLVGCSKQEKAEKAESLGEIYKNEGIPVKIINVEKEDFVKKLTYEAEITPIEEISPISGINDKVDSIKIKIGQRVKKDEICITFPKDNPSAKYYQTKAALDISKKTYERMNKLFEQGGISKQRLEEVQTQYKVNLANFNAIKKLVQVKAPIDGIITDINVQKNNNVNVGSTLFSVANFKKMKSTIWVNDKDISKIKKNMKAQVKVENIILKGYVSQVALAKNQNKSAFAVDVNFYNKGKLKRSGIIADIEIELYRKENVKKIERKFVYEANNNYYTYIASSGKALRTNIEIGEENNQFIEVISGLEENDKLIIEGQNLVKNNDKIKVIN